MGSGLVRLLLIFSLIAFFSGAGCAEKAEEEKEAKKAEEVKEAITEEALPEKEIVEEAKGVVEEAGEAVEKAEEEIEFEVEEVKELIKEEISPGPQKEMVEAKEVVAEVKTAAVEVPDTVPIHSKAWDAAVNKVGKHEVHGKQYQDFTFSHKKHAEDYKIACTDCHHVYKEKKNVWKKGDPVKKCEECHNIVDLTKKKDPMSLYAAFHNNCVGCHKTHMKEWKTTGKVAGEPKPKVPIGCTKCHTKRPE